MVVTLDLRKHAEDLVDRARMAPSLHNAQPWAFRVRSNAVEVYADRARAVPVIDPDDRQLLIGVGAAVFVVRLGVSVLGAEPTIALLPGAEHGDLVALVSVGPEHLPTLAEARLMEQVPLRRTVREHMDPEVPATVRERLTREAAVESATLSWISEPADRHVLAHLVTLAERRESGDPRIGEELARWAGGHEPRHGPGILEETLRLLEDDERSTAEPVPVERRPAVAILTTDGDRPADWLRAGQALMRVLLVATADGLAASYLNQPLELPDVRPRVREELGLVGFPQAIIHLGRPRGSWPDSTPRHPVADVLRP